MADWAEAVTLTLEGGGPEVALQGTTSRVPVAGVAGFPDLVVTGAASGLRLMAASAALGEIASDPFDVHGVFHAAGVTAGNRHTCALDEGGNAYCWGDNSSGKLGSGDFKNRFLPTRVAAQVVFSSLQAYADQTCGLSVNGDAYCWGSNAGGALGIGETGGAELKPVQVTGTISGRSWRQATSKAAGSR